MRGHFYKKIPEEYDFSNEVDKHYQLDENNIMNSNIFRLNWNDVFGALTSAVLVSVIGYVLKQGDVFALDWRIVINTGVMAGFGSLLKNLLYLS